MDLGLQRSPLPGYFDDLAKLAVTEVSKSDVEKDFLMFEKSTLQPLCSKQPAALLRTKFTKSVVWVGYEEWLVTPKHQHLIINESGLGSLDEIVQEEEEEIKLGQFLTKNKNTEALDFEMSDNEAFASKDVSGILYVNDIHLSDDMVRKGSMWSLFGDLGLSELDQISGINTPWGYAGTKASVFPVHLEDHDVGSINQHLDGANKVWFFVHPDDRDKFVDGLKKMYPNEYKMCSTYHRHKFLYVDPVKVQQAMGITITTVIQRPGDVVVTWPGTFHWGFNVGLNVSMAVNYCPRSELARKIVCSARQCDAKCQIGSTIVPPVRKVFEYRPYKCEVLDCSWNGTTSSQGLRGHLKRCHGIIRKIGEIGAVTCEGCGKKVKKLSDHKKICQTPVWESCNLCKKRVPDRRKHWLKECRECRKCQKTFRSSKLAYEHYQC